MKDSKQAGQASLPSSNPTVSFWHSQPSAILRNHRTTSSLPPTADITIIGSGIAGVFAAYFLNFYSPTTSIAIVEAREACSGATGRNGGHCAPKVYNKPVHTAQFERQNLDFLRAFVENHEIDCEWKNVSGCHAYCGKEGYDAAVEGVKRLQQEDAEMGNTISYTNDRRDLDEMCLGNQVYGAVVDSRAATLWPYKLIAWILEKLLQDRPHAGSGSFNLQTNTAVSHLQQLDDATWKVHTPRGVIASKQVFLATNAYTSYLLPSFTELIIPVKGEMSALIPPPQSSPFVGKYSYAFIGGEAKSEQRDEYLIQRPSQRTDDKYLLFGGGRRYALQTGVGISDDSSVDDGTSSFLRAELNHVMKISHNKTPLKAQYQWSGIMGFSRDELPWVGPIPEALGGGQGLWISSGFTGHGMAHATLCSKSIVKELLGINITESNVPIEFGVSENRAEEVLKLPEIRALEINGAMGPISEL